MKIKTKLIRLASLLLAAILCVGLCACSTNTKTVAKSENNKISQAMYSLMTSLTKGSISYYITQKYGNYNSTDFWMTVTDGETQLTYKDYYTYVVDEKVKQYLAALDLFDELGLSLTDAEIAEIDEEMDWFVEYDGNGSKNTLNGVLAAYGANYKTLREYKLMNAKITKLSTYLYGASGEKIADNVKQDYLDENYYAFKQILLPTYDYVYVKDANGDEIYYQTDSSGSVVQGTNPAGDKYNKISYDTVNGVSFDLDKDGVDDKDTNGDTVYYTMDDSDNYHIAYKTSSAKRVPATDSNGYEMTVDFSDEKIAEIKTEANNVLSQITAGDTKAFENYITIYDENYSVGSEEQRGSMYYLASGKTYADFMTDGSLLDGICAETDKLEIGGILLYESDYGFHIIMRYEPEDGAFNKTENTFWFTDENGRYDFVTDLTNRLFTERLKPYSEGVTIDEEVKANVDISTITPNYNFY